MRTVHLFLLLFSASLLVTPLGCAGSGSRRAPPPGDGGADGDNDSGADAQTKPDGTTQHSCGDGTVNQDEICDDGNQLDGDGCSSRCEVEKGWKCSGQPSVCTLLCGNGVIDTDEACDGQNLNGETCTSLPDGYSGGTLSCTQSCHFDTADCVQPGCGNGTVDAGEECDDGNQSNDDACLNNCKNATCGDGHVWNGQEECDDGNQISGDGCSETCVTEFCGDGIVQAGIGEQCEGTAQQTCSTTCGTTGIQHCSATTCTWNTCIPPNETCDGQDDDCDGMTDTGACLSVIYQFHNPSTADHMDKVNDNTPDSGYQYDNVYFYLYNTQVPNTSELFQLLNPTIPDHMVSMSTTEGSPAYGTPQSIGFCVAQTPTWPAAGLDVSQVCRYYNHVTHDHMIYRYLDDNEIAGTIGSDYSRERCLYAWGFHGP